MGHLSRVIIVVTLFISAYFSLTELYKYLDPNTTKSEEDTENSSWVATSPYWLDRQACRWIGLCGLSHWRPDPAARRWTRRLEFQKLEREKNPEKLLDENSKWHSRENQQVEYDQIKQIILDDAAGEPRERKDVPQYVIDNAPLIHLYSGEQFWPADITKHLKHTMPFLNYTSLNMSDDQHTPVNLHKLNRDYQASNLFMQSKNDVEGRPDWLGSEYCKPVPYDEDYESQKEEDSGIFDEARLKEEAEAWYDASRYDQPSVNITFPDDVSGARGNTELRKARKRRGIYALQNFTANSKLGGFSHAPSYLILVNKGPDILDAFWFFFYSYNLGTTVFNIRFGNHIGDWEHTLVRFHKGVPKAVFGSAHSGGLAYAWKALEKSKGKNGDGRPILYSAVGSHAMYATPGRHPYVLPFGLLADVTDRGPLWDPSLNFQAYYFNTSITHDVDSRTSSGALSSMSSLHNDCNISTDSNFSSFQPTTSNPSAPAGWWWYSGRWGDKFYELRDWRQWRFFGQYHYVNGPLGPRFKNLGRAKVCQSGTSCRIVENLSERRSWIG